VFDTFIVLFLHPVPFVSPRSDVQRKVKQFLLLLVQFPHGWSLLLLHELQYGLVAAQTEQLRFGWVLPSVVEFNALFVGALDDDGLVAAEGLRVVVEV
jgi:hypothetical protein